MPIWLCYCSLLLQMIAQIKKAKDSVRENTSDIAFDITDVTEKLSDTSTLKALWGVWFTFTFPLTNIFFLHPLEVVGRDSETQLQVGEKYIYLFNLRPNICKS